MRKDHGAHPAKSGGQAHRQRAVKKESTVWVRVMTICLHVYIACELNQKHMSSHTNGPDLRGTEQMCFSLPPPV